MERAQPEQRRPSPRHCLLMQLFIGVWNDLVRHLSCIDTDPSDLAVLRGAMFKWVLVEMGRWVSNRDGSDGKAVCRRDLTCYGGWREGQVLKYSGQFISLLKRLRDKTFSKRGFSWSGKLLSSLLLTLTHTYPLEDKFVNCDEWDSEGKDALYCHVSWLDIFIRIPLRPSQILG